MELRKEVKAFKNNSTELMNMAARLDQLVDIQ
jgi:hypothetical protein